MYACIGQRHRHARVVRFDRQPLADVDADADAALGSHRPAVDSLGGRP